MISSTLLDQVMPCIARLRQLVESHEQFTLLHAGVKGDGRRGGVLGLRCARKNDATQTTLAFSVVVVSGRGTLPPRAAASVAWARPLSATEKVGFRSIEDEIEAAEVGEAGLSPVFVAELQRLEKAFADALARGTPK